MMNTTRLNGGQLEIKPRRMDFPFENIKAKKFYRDNSILSAFLSTLSGTFPPGESEFIASVRLYQKRIEDPELQKNIRGFIGQEGHHSHQHKRMNEVLNQLGWDAQYVEQSMQRGIIKRNKNKRLGSDRFRLALTAGIEHLTAIMAEFMLTTPEVFSDVAPEVAELLLWHAVEELEHKAVAFDVYMTCEKDQKYMRTVLKLGTLLFITKVTRYTFQLLWKSKTLPSWREIKETYDFFYNKKTGLITKIKPLYKDYFKQGFHPWDHQNAHLIDEWKEKHYNPEHDKSAG